MIIKRGWLILIGLSIGAGWTQLAHASTTVKQSAITPVVAKKTYLTASQTGKLYQFQAAGEQVQLKAVHQLRNFPHTKWTCTQQTYLFKNGKKYLYYYVKNKTGKSGWVWHQYLKLTDVRLAVPLIGQRPQLTTGCEITATAMMLQYAGAKVTKMQLAKEMPRSSNPNRGFVGSPYNSVGWGHYVYPGGLMSTVKRHVGTAVNLTGSRLPKLKQVVTNNHPVVTWMAGLDGFQTHSITVTGYSAKRIYYNDPWTKQKTSLSNQQFITYWQKNQYRALSY